MLKINKEENFSQFLYGLNKNLLENKKIHRQREEVLYAKTSFKISKLFSTNLRGRRNTNMIPSKTLNKDEFLKIEY